MDRYDKYIGQMLDNRYELLEVIGIGGMAVVYKALCHRLNRLVAVKILKDDYQQDEEFRRRFQAESQAIAMLSHANIVAVYDISSGGDLDYIVMELIDGMTLKEYVTQRGEIGWRETLHFSTQIAKALYHAHSRGVVHRDIKPHNIMVLRDGSVKVADFGIAQMASNRNTLTREALGSVHYISPEQARGSGTDQRTDIYSLGVVMYELLTGQLPYDGETPVAIAIQHINGGAKPPRELKPSIPVGLEQIVMKAMEPDMNQRYNTAEELADDLEAFRKDPAMIFPYGAQGAALAAAQAASLKKVEEAIERQKQSAKTVHRQPETPASQSASAAEEQNATGTGQDKPVQTGQKTARTKTARTGGTQEKPDKQNADGGTESRERGPSMLAILIGTVCVLLVLAGIGYFLYQYALRDLFFSTRDVEVPYLVGKLEEELDPEDYPGLQLVIGARTYDTQPLGTVISQTPEAGKLVKEGNNTVTLTVSQGPHTETLPDLTGNTQQDASLVLENLNMSLNVLAQYEYNTEVSEGRVIRTQPTAHTALREGDSVTLVVSMGQEIRMVNVPNLSDGSYTLEQAQDELDRVGLSLSHAVETDSQQPAGIVVDQNLAAGASVREDTKITLYVSNGALAPREESEEEPEEPSLEEPEAQPEETQPEEPETEEEADPEAQPETPDTPETQSEPAQTPAEEQPPAAQPMPESEPKPPAAPEPEPTQEPTEAPPPLTAEIPDAQPTGPDTRPEPAPSTPVNLDERVTRTVTIELPQTGGVMVVTLKLDGQQVGRYSADPGDRTLTCEVTGSGVQQLDVYFDGVLTQTQRVDFTQGGG